MTRFLVVAVFACAGCSSAPASVDAATHDAHAPDTGIDTGIADGECYMTRPAAHCGDGVCDPGCEGPASCATDCPCTSTAQCTTGLTCDATGHCVCVPNCAGRSCGDNGCGGSCGSCSGGTGCTSAGHCELCSFHTDCASCSNDGNFCGWCHATSQCIHTMDASGASVCSGGWAWTPAAC